MAGYYFGCPHCGAKLEARDANRAGRAVDCPQCQQALTIPPPPPMGVSLTGPSAAPARRDEPSLVNVSTDKGFKRGMMPAKAYSDADAGPSANPDNAERLPSSEALDNAEQFVMESTGDLEGYSLTVAESGPEDAMAPVVKRKKKKDRVAAEPEPEPVPPWEDPKYQLLALVLIVGLIGGIWTWLTSGKEEKKEVIAPPPVIVPAKPGQLPGAADAPDAGPPKPPEGLPGAAPDPTLGLPGAGEQPTETETAPPAAPVIRDGLPGAGEQPAPETPPQPQAMNQRRDRLESRL